MVTLMAFAYAFTDAALTPGLLAGTTAVSALVWTPTSVMRFQAAFFPGPPHPRLRDADGRGWAFRDVVVVLRCGLAEHAMSSLPWLFISIWLASQVARTGSSGTLTAVLALVIAALVVRSLWRRTLQVEAEVARLESAVGRTGSARRRLERLLRVRFGAGADALRHSLASARFRDGDVPGALQMLEAIQDPARWYVMPLRAQMMVARDPGGARAVVASHDLGQGEATMIQWLADLHEGHPERVRAAEVEARDLLDSVAPDVAGMLRLLLAAAWAPVDEARASHLLEHAGWSRSELPWLSTVWPAVGEPLREVRWLEPDGERPL